MVTSDLALDLKTCTAGTGVTALAPEHSPSLRNRNLSNVSYLQFLYCVSQIILVTYMKYQCMIIKDEKFANEVLDLAAA